MNGTNAGNGCVPTEQPILVEKLVDLYKMASEARGYTSLVKSSLNRISRDDSPDGPYNETEEKRSDLSSVSIEERIDVVRGFLIDILRNLNDCQQRLSRLV